jgi:phosphoserine phosphatase
MLLTQLFVSVFMAVKGFVPYSGIIRAVPQESQLKLFGLDMDGTLLKKYENAGGHNTSVDELFHILDRKSHGIFREYCNVVETYIHFPDKEAEWFKALLNLLDGQPASYAMRKMSHLPYESGAKELLRKTKGAFDRGIVSCGVDFVAQQIAREMELEFCVVNYLYREDGVFTGKGKLNVMPSTKAKAMLKVCNDFDVLPSEAGYGGNDFTDRKVFEVVGFAVALNADEETSMAANLSINKPSKLLSILKVLPGMRKRLASL